MVVPVGSFFLHWWLGLAGLCRLLLGALDLNGSVLEHLVTLVLLFLYVSRVAGQGFLVEEGVPQCLLAGESLVGIQMQQALNELHRNLSDAWTLLPQVVANLLFVGLLGAHICQVLIGLGGLFGYA